MSPFSKILIANRGEIAVRVIRTCREMGIKTVAIYSGADRNSLHVLMADEAYYVGPAPATQSYLNIERILRIAKQAEVEAIHPGYGFLSQNPEFARRCEEEGIVFIGPPAKVHLFSGDKLNAKFFLKDRGIPVIPGSRKPLKSASEALELAEKIGYPVMLKPRFGGGGIGMRICHSPQELEEAFNLSLKLASAAFKSAELYIERYYPRARHIEVQILADRHGNILHLFERECSIQRRFQKLIEEAPSPAINDELREKVTSLAVRIAEIVGYINAGTVEFLYVPEEGSFLFMEINSRIQVEHPVTEMITGIDIVKEQLKIAAGECLEYDQEEISVRGHAIEARIYAEDPYSGFTPSPGIITEYIPPRGIGIRVDDSVYPGAEIPPYYDPLIAKLIAWGRNRAESLARLRRALREFVIKGVKTNIPLHLALLEDSGFLSGDYYTKYLEEKVMPRGIPKIISTVNIPPRSFPPSISQQAPEQMPASAWRLSGRLLQAKRAPRRQRPRLSF